MQYKNLILVADFDYDSKVDNAQEIYNKWHFNDKYWAEITFYTIEKDLKVVTIKSKDFLKVRYSTNSEFFRIHKIFKESDYLDINNIWSNLWQKKNF